MQLLDNKTSSQLDELGKMEATLINKGFNRSKSMGLVFLSNSITSFVNNYIKPKYGEVVLSMSSEYRYFIIKLLEFIDVEFKEAALNELLIPTLNKIDCNDLINILTNGDK